MRCTNFLHPVILITVLASGRWSAAADDVDSPVAITNGDTATASSANNLVDRAPSSSHLRPRELQWANMPFQFTTTETSFTVTWGCDEKENTLCVIKFGDTDGNKACKKRFRIYRDVIGGDGQGGTCSKTINNLECNTSYTVKIVRSRPNGIGSFSYDVSVSANTLVFQILNNDVWAFRC